eukprot:augustus_masked-scaffold_4-processed-gene-15.39-mRNA-1 protein AED:1.00 eAED:1.00 QI:0/-1/0/0/-1/1/1/0/414
MAKLSHTNEEFNKLIKQHAAGTPKSRTTSGRALMVKLGVNIILLIATFGEDVFVRKIIEEFEYEEKDVHLAYRLGYTALLFVLFYLVRVTDPTRTESNPVLSEALLFPSEVIEHSFLIIRYFDLLNDLKWCSLLVGPTLLAYLSSAQSVTAMSLRGVEQEAQGLPPEALLPFIILCEIANLYFLFNDTTLLQGSILGQSFPVDIPINEVVTNFFSSFPALFIDDEFNFAGDHIDLTWGGACALLLTFLGINNGIYQLLACVRNLIFGESHPFEDSETHFGDSKLRLFINIVTNVLYIGFGIGAWLSLKAMEMDFRRQSAYAALYVSIIFLSIEICLKLKLLKLTGIKSLPIPLTIFVLWMFSICATQDLAITEKLGRNLMPINWYTAMGSAVTLSSLSYITKVSSEINAVLAGA